MLRDGSVAIAFYGSDQERGAGDGYAISDGRAYGAYLTIVSADASDVTLSVRFNASSSPVANGWTFNTSEYLGPPREASDGSVWASYVNGDGTLIGKLVH